MSAKELVEYLVNKEWSKYQMDKFIDDSKIPKGIYCYDEKGLCPYYSHKVIAEDIQIPFCLYLEEGDLGDLTSVEFEQLKEELTLSDKELWKLYPLDLLWDSVKECGVNEEEDDE